MKNQGLYGNPSTFQELVNFLNVLNNSRGSEKSLLKKPESARRIVRRFEKEFSARL